MERQLILEGLRTHSREIERLGVERLALFGSVSRGDTTDTSDIDILVRFRPNEKNFDNFMNLRSFVEDLFQGEHIDLVLEDALKPAIRSRVLSEATDVA